MPYNGDEGDLPTDSFGSPPDYNDPPAARGPPATSPDIPDYDSLSLPGMNAHVQDINKHSKVQFSSDLGSPEFEDKELEEARQAAATPDKDMQEALAAAKID